MDGLQPESAPGIQHFLQWKSRPGIRKIGCGGPDNTLGSHYISQAVLQDYLTVDKIKTLLDELFEDSSQSPVNADRVRAKYLRPFAILLSCGCGRMIRHFHKHQGLQDTSLPFRSEPEDFPKSAIKNLFETFRKEQWQFYPIQLDYDMSDDLANDYILPITAKEEIGNGGSAILYKIIVDEAYNTLKPVDPTRVTTESVAANTFALKTYRTPEAQKYFENERDAFIRLRHGRRPHPNIIEFYGSFVRDGTYNIILEYADRGTLDDYMKNTPEPKTITEITTFWRNFFPVMHGLAHVHGTPGTASDGPNILLGYGMNPYGAPETYRDKDLETCHLQVLQSADIWSTGCVLSEVATWITEGIEKLLEYRRRRQEEIFKRSKGSITDEERFHYVSEVLDAVKGIHVEIRDNSRRNDLITPWVIERLVNGMVRPDPNHRATARVFLETSKEILSEAEWQLKQAMPNGPAPYPGHTVWDMTVDVRKRRAPPLSPPDQAIASSPHIEHIQEQATVPRRPSARYAQSDSYHLQQGFAAEPSGEEFR
ncbi:MAG: hypothetical protein Q9209_004933 [Squamulea sp. 1 TL-2023]